MRKLAALIVVVIGFAPLTACTSQTGAKPPLGYVTKHEAFHNSYKTMVDRYGVDHPGPAANDLKNMWASEGVMIEEAKKGQFPNTPSQ